MTAGRIAPYAETFARIEAATAAIDSAGYPGVATAILRRMRDLRGVIRRTPEPGRADTDLHELTTEVERLAGTVAA